MSPLDLFLTVVIAAVVIAGVTLVLRIAYRAGVDEGRKLGAIETQLAMRGDERRSRLRLLELSGLTADGARMSLRAWERGDTSPLANRARRVLGARP